MQSKHIKNLEQSISRGKNVFIAPGATVLGDVTLEEESSVWFNAVVRGDTDRIYIGARTNIQDGAIIHCDPGDPSILGDDVIVGHQAIVHGATIDNNVLIGMGATVLNRAKIGKYCIIGAHALVTNDTEIPDYSVVMGSPGKVVKQVTEEQMRDIEQNAENYVHHSRKYLDLE